MLKKERGWKSRRNGCKSEFRWKKEETLEWKRGGREGRGGWSGDKWQVKVRK